MGRFLSNSLIVILRQRISAVSATDAMHQDGGNQEETVVEEMAPLAVTGLIRPLKGEVER